MRIVKITILFFLLMNYSLAFSHEKCNEGSIIIDNIDFGITHWSQYADPSVKDKILKRLHLIAKLAKVVVFENYNVTNSIVENYDIKISSLAKKDKHKYDLLANSLEYIINNELAKNNKEYSAVHRIKDFLDQCNLQKHMIEREGAKIWIYLSWKECQRKNINSKVKFIKYESWYPCSIGKEKDGMLKDVIGLGYGLTGDAAISEIYSNISECKKEAMSAFYNGNLIKKRKISILSKILHEN